MNTQLFGATSVLVLAASLQTVSAQSDPGCIATAGLRAAGTADVVRITNQSENQSISLEVRIRLVNANGIEQGQELARPLAVNASSTLTVGQIFSEAGVRSFNPNFFIQIIQHDASNPVTPALGLQFQATYKNSTNGQVLPLLFTCNTPDA